jgi:hypothetical protein
MAFPRSVLLAAVLGGALVPAASAQQKLASPRDSTKATIAGATIAIDYGRPSKRGREIFGGLVPFDRVWRTGANEATTLVTDKPLMFGSLMVPAGKYTLWTVPGKAGWKLVINKQTGQWGTNYDQAQDLGRVDMKVETLASPVEQMVIKLQPAAGGGVLRIEWDKTAAVVPFMVH